jgi:hypothetical protein
MGTPADRCRRRFLERFPGGFADAAYEERVQPLRQGRVLWLRDLERSRFRARREAKDFSGLARDALGAVSRAGLLRPDEKVRLKDALADPRRARRLVEALYSLLYGRGKDPFRFRRWLQAMGAAGLGEVSWPLATAFGALAEPQHQYFVRPSAVRDAGRAYGEPLAVVATVAAEDYGRVLTFARRVRRDLRDLVPGDLLDVEAFFRLLAER